MERLVAWLEKKKIKKKEKRVNKLLNSLKGETASLSNVRLVKIIPHSPQKKSTLANSHKTKNGQNYKKKRQIGKITSSRRLNLLKKVSATCNKTQIVAPYNEEIRKKAILIGLNYPGSHYSLNGCVNDVRNGAMFLKERDYDVKMLEDKDISLSYNVLQALTELRNSAQQVVFFHYSGHGTQMKDLDADEEDNLDEVIYSKDDVLITDDDINRILLSYPENKTVFLIFDCCHSGSIADLPYILNVDGKVKEEKVKKIAAAKIICISGCQDNQTSADMTERGISFGALSSTVYSLLRSYNGKDVTWKIFYQDLVKEMKRKKYSQYPILSSSHLSFFDEKVVF